MRKAHPKCTMAGFKWAVARSAAVVMILLLSLAQSAFADAAYDREEKAVLKAARAFLDAEIRQDYPAVYACFAPSSPYVQTHTYRQYLADAKAAPDRVVSYQIIRVSYIQDNKDPKSITPADRIAQVEVDVTYLHSGTNFRSVVNIGFIFLKQGGKWYKS